MNKFVDEAFDLMEINSRIEKCVEAVCLVSNISKKEFYNKSRTRNLIDSRRMVYAFCKESLNLGYSKTAKFFNVNHATIIHHYKCHNELIQYDVFYKDKFEGFVELVRADIGFFDIKNIIKEVKSIKEKHLAKAYNEENSSKKK
tara:strand:+ start:118 stop:549 length:432 start_codon:yes stop_codon:yes gene_type:complete